MTDRPDKLPESPPKGPISWMAGNSVASNLVMLTCLVGGFFALKHIKQEVFPDIAEDIVQISVEYPEANPEEVEKGIILVVEESVRGLDGVKEVDSVANEGSGTISVEIMEGYDIQKLSEDIKSEVDRITTFPEDAEKPVVQVVSHKHEVLTVVLYGNAKDTTLHELGEQARDILLQNPDITQVELTGVPGLEIGIEISQENQRRYGITLDDIATKLRNTSVDIPSGGLKTSSGEILVRIKERRDYGDQFARLPIVTTDDGSEILLGDIAKIDDSFADTDRYSRFNGQPAVMLEVYRVGDQTPISVADAVKQQLKEIEPMLPPGISTAIDDDRSDVYRQRIDLLLANGMMGLCLVMITLGLFLEARLAFWVMMGIPVSFLGSFLFLPAADISINMMSLFAYIIAVGIVVDDAIVVGENVYHHHQNGMPFHKAAIRGAREVAIPVTFSVLTNIVTFMPLYFIPGIMGKIFKMIPVVVGIVFLISLGECLFVLPSHLAHQRERHRRGISAWLHTKQQAFSHGFMRWVKSRYGPFLKFTMRHRYLTVAVAMALLGITLSYALSGRMGFELFPKVESDFSQAELVLPYGSPVEKTEAIMKRLLDGANKVIAESGQKDHVTSITADIDRCGSKTGRMRVSLADPDIRKNIMSTEEFTNRWRKEVGEVAGVEYLKFASDAGGPGSHGRPVTVELSHRDIDVLDKACVDLADTLATYPNTADIDDGYQPGKQQLDFKIKPEGESLGLTRREVARQVRQALYGAEVLRQQRGRTEIKIMVRLPESERSTEQTIHDLLIKTPAGSYVPLREIATYQRGRAYTVINRRNGRRVVSVSADVTPQSKAGEVLEDLKKNVLPGLIKKYHGLQYSFEGHEADMRDSLQSLAVTFPIALLGLYAMLAIPFRSYTQPLIIMMSIPYGIVGAILGHLVMGYNLCLPSLFGIVALAGIVVNDSLIMIDFANTHRRKSDLTHRIAIHSAAIQRFRPIILTTLTTFGGLAPMIFETSRQARFMVPMALSLGFGLLFSTLVTLVIVPSMYLVVEDAKRFCATAWQKIGGKVQPKSDCVNNSNM